MGRSAGVFQIPTGPSRNDGPACRTSFGNRIPSSMALPWSFEAIGPRARSEVVATLTQHGTAKPLIRINLQKFSTPRVAGSSPAGGALRESVCLKCLRTFSKAHSKRSLQNMSAIAMSDTTTMRYIGLISEFQCQRRILRQLCLTGRLYQGYSIALGSAGWFTSACRGEIECPADRFSNNGTPRGNAAANFTSCCPT